MGNISLKKKQKAEYTDCYGDICRYDFLLFVYGRKSGDNA